MRKPYLRQLGEGGVLAAIGAVMLLLIPTQIDKIHGMETAMSPSFLPTVLGVAIIVVGLALIGQSFRKDIKKATLDFSRSGAWRVFLAAVLLVAYTLLFPRLGFVFTSALFIAVFTYLFGLRSWWKIVLTMTMVPVAVWLFFEKLFRIPLPHGLVF